MWSYLEFKVIITLSWSEILVYAFFYTEEFESPEHACVYDVSDGSPLGKYSFLSLWKPGMRKNMIIG